ncbi:MAG: hypothetical protein ISN29_08265 [Gammaproteobacteria bacterium AqS3]|nr:hypothetical protein [Gammaproteobacteria bacterium AqS3]
MVPKAENRQNNRGREARRTRKGDPHADQRDAPGSAETNIFVLQYAAVSGIFTRIKKPQTPLSSGLNLTTAPAWGLVVIRVLSGEFSAMPKRARRIYFFVGKFACQELALRRPPLD